MALNNVPSDRAEGGEGPRDERTGDVACAERNELAIRTYAVPKDRSILFGRNDAVEEPNDSA